MNAMCESQTKCETFSPPACFLTSLRIHVSDCTLVCLTMLILLNNTAILKTFTRRRKSTVYPFFMRKFIWLSCLLVCLDCLISAIKLQTLAKLLSFFLALNESSL